MQSLDLRDQVGTVVFSLGWLVCGVVRFGTAPFGSDLDRILVLFYGLGDCSRLIFWVGFWSFIMQDGDMSKLCKGSHGWWFDGGFFIIHPGLTELRLLHIFA